MVSQTKSGKRASEKTASRQSRSAIATTVASTVVTFAEHGGRGRRDDGLDAADVVRDPTLHLAGPRPREECERESLQVPVHLGAQVVHHALPDPVGQERLPDAERAGHDRDHDHPRHERGQQADSLLGNRYVEHLAEEERGDDAEARRDENQARNRCEASTVRAEEPDDPPEVGLTHGGIGRALRRVAAGEGAETSSWHSLSLPARGRSWPSGGPWAEVHVAVAGSASPIANAVS